MLLLTLSLSWPEVIILQIGALILGCTVYFFYSSWRSLQQTLQKGGVLPKPKQKQQGLFSIFRNKKNGPEAGRPQIRHASVVPPHLLAAALPPTAGTDARALTSLKENLQEQYDSLNALVQRVEQLEAGGLHAKEAEGKLHMRIRELESALAEKTEAVAQAQQQEGLLAEITARMDEVYQQFTQLQQKTAALEKQAAAAQELTLELEELQQSYRVLQKEFVRKQERLEELSSENLRLQHELAIVSEKLTAAGHRQQLLMQQNSLVNDLQMDMEAVSEGQSKLHNQLRRIAELESMLEQFSAKPKRSGV